MKKNDGYVIIYVVFVILFLCIIAVGTCTSALNNLKIQYASVKQMQDRYTAEGDIEQFMAEVCVAGEGIDSGGYLYSLLSEAESAAKARFPTIIGDTLNGRDISIAGGSWANGSEYKVTLESSEGSSKVTSEVVFKVTIATPADTVTIEGEDQTYYAYKITDVTSKYISYTLESTGGEPQ